MENNKMLAKLKTGKFYNHFHVYSRENEKRENVLNRHAGEWVEIETEHLFNNQYNITLDGVGIRIFDADITEIKNDARNGACKCAYCGKTFPTLDDYKKHVDENKRLFETKEHCAKCFWNQSKIIDTQREKTREITENGDEITKETTTYTWRKECTHGEKYNAPCSLLECANEKYLQLFTPENTYFLKYPRGYNNYFRELSFDDKMHELHFEKFSENNYKRAFVGSYELHIVFNNGKTVNHIIVNNARRAYVLTADTLKKAVENCNYCTRWFISENGLFKDFPTTYYKQLINACDALLEHYKKDYINEFIKL